MPDHNNIELRSEEVQEVMNRIPPAIQRCGITVMALIVAVFISISCLVKIPITKECKFAITWENGVTKPIIKVSLPSAAMESILSNDSTEVKMCSHLFPKEFNNTIHTTIFSGSICSCSDGTYYASVQVKSHIEEILSRNRFSIVGTAYVTISHKTLINELNALFSK